MADLVEVDRRVAAQVRELRTQHGLSQAQLAERVRALSPGFRWTNMTVMAVENERRILRLNEALGLARLFGVEVQELWGACDEERLRIETHDSLRRAHEQMSKAGRNVDQLVEKSPHLETDSPENRLLWRQRDGLRDKLMKLAEELEHIGTADEMAGGDEAELLALPEAPSAVEAHRANGDG